MLSMKAANAVSLLFTLLFANTLWSQDNPQVKIVTNKGEMVVELFKDKAPQTVANFLSYVNDGYYNGTIFHRVIKGFMIQGGGLTPDMAKKKTKAPIRNEADNGLQNSVYTIAMARTGDPHSATSQFFINTNDNRPLNHRSKSAQGWGYCVFGKVRQGTKTVRAVENAVTGIKQGFKDVPVNTVIIESIIELPGKKSE
ncbi:MAG: peptidyl-prolyl cis-trans isomerase [Chitinivibrionales bacterium]|nr:peptidyl-prolyl cis-trans isomerase [Chitinivibrionales bacterium]